MVSPLRMLMVVVMAGLMLCANASVDDVEEVFESTVVEGMKKFDEVDTDKNNQLHLKEFKILFQDAVRDLAKRQKKVAENVPDHQMQTEFQKYDTDKSGMISREEWKEVIKYNVLRKKEADLTIESFKRADADKNGLLSYREMQDYFGMQDYTVGEITDFIGGGDSDGDLSLTLDEYRQGRIQWNLKKNGNLGADGMPDFVPDRPDVDAIKTFNESDVDKNGKLTPQEFFDLINSQVATVDASGKKVQLPEKKLKEAFKAYDTNKDFQISMDEYMTVINATIMDAKAAHDFDEADQNRDKYLDKEEHKHLMTEFGAVMGKEIPDEDIAKVFTASDKNEDGKLESTEWVSFVRETMDAVEKYNKAKKAAAGGSAPKKEL